QHTRQYIKKIDPALVSSLQAPKSAVETFLDDSFGVFIHWDHSSQLPVPMSWGRREKTRRPVSSRGIPAAEYDGVYKTFNPEKFDAEEWVKLFKDAGARYIVFTAKHHGGFSMWDTKVSDFDIMNTPFKRDVMKELADACKKYDMKLGWYYSQPDWHHAGYGEFAKDKKKYESYLKDFVFPQVKELVSNYGEIYTMWWDGLGQHPENWKSPDLLQMVREIQPNILSNPRFAPRSWRMGDYDTAEREVGRFQINRAWETCTVIGGAWGWAGDSVAMDLADCITLLVRCKGSGGNLLLNTGPQADGAIVANHAERYRQIGEWNRQFGESIFGTRGGPYTPAPWGTATRKGNTVYLHILGSWQHDTLSLPALAANIKSTRVLTGGEAVVKQSNGVLEIKLPVSEHHKFDTIIALELDRPASDLSVIKTSEEQSLTIGAKTSASSERSAKSQASNVVATDPTQFSEGTMVRAAWQPAFNDKNPWIQLDLAKVCSIGQIEIAKGVYGRDPGPDTAYQLELRINGQWLKVHSEKAISVEHGIILPQAYETDGIRISYMKGNNAIAINMINAFGLIVQ
ncbi:MAG: alpha-L-fucosidase, partial [Lentisphaeraceae bacterium]|nr:alpha-L-fucosidase [Lentisphaeraceae bacterium]